MKFQEIIRKSVQEGIVLLKNENNALPLKKDDDVSVFGRCQINYYKSGTGSGGSVHIPYSVNLIDGFKNLEKEGFSVPKLNENLLSTYQAWIEKNPFDNGNGEWASEPWCQKEMEISDSFAKEMANTSNKALFVIGRTAGEDQDNKKTEGSFYLTQSERECLKNICAYFNDVIVILNVSNIIDLSWINDEAFKNHITAVMFSWQGGMQGGQGLADILCGKANPCGKLSDTIAFSIDDYPSTKNFGSESDELYEEDIYVGYRYFTTFAKEKVQYPFGFGLSYTTFEISNASYEYDDKELNFIATVKNTGDVAGKEVVQLYAQCPQGKLGKSNRSLCGWCKTKELQAGESTQISINVKLDALASYDDSGITGFPYSYVLEEGTYSFFYGTDCMNTSLATTKDKKELVIEKTCCVEKLSQCCACERDMNRIKPVKDGEGYRIEYEKVPLSKEDIAQKLKDRNYNTIAYTGDKGIRFSDVVKDRSLMDSFIAQLDVNELKTLIRGEGMMSRKVTPGIASAFGGISEKLHDFGIPAAGCADGPSGIRLDNGGEATLVPIGTLLACTWNEELVESLYVEVGKEMMEKKIDLLLGPGCNIHRNPLNGRNFEYFSEDPLLTGYMASAVVKGLAKNKALGTIKHFALNNQESHRRTTNSVVSERAVREIYLKPFEIAVKKGGARSIMTSYNGINGHWSASNFDLNTSILRNEWKFTGFVMTDWWAAMNDCVTKGDATVRNIAAMIKARNDVYMVVVNDTADKGGLGDNLDSSLENGTLTVGELQICVRDIINVLCETYAASCPLRPLKNEIKVDVAQYDIPSDCHVYSIKQNIDLSKVATPVYVKIDETRSYNICGAFYKDGGDTLSQSITNLTINDKLCGSFECRSTDGKTVYTTAAQLELKEGTYKIDLIHTKPGIDVRSLSVVPENETPVTAGIFN